jgi:hypothetical protein
MKKYLLISGFLIAAFFASNSVTAQVTQEWVQNYNYTSGTDEYMTDMKMDDLGNIYICGWVEYAPTNRDYLLLKFSKNGQLIWSNVHDRTWSDRFNSMQLDSKGNVYAFGGTVGVEHVIIKYDSVGNLIWEMNIDSSYNSAAISSRFTLDDLDNLYLTGTTHFSNGDMLTIKYDSSGVMLWNKIFSSIVFGHAGGGDVNFKNNFIYVAGASNLGGPNGRDITILKYDTSGLLLDTIYCDGNSSSEGGAQFGFDADNNFVIAGIQNNATPGTGRDIVLAKIDTNGNKAWFTVFNNNNSQNTEEIFKGIKLDKSNNIYLLCRATYSQEPPLSPRAAYTIIKYNPEGDSLWTRKYVAVSNSSNNPEDFVLDNEGNAYITGYSNFNQLNTRISTVKYSSSGEKLWNIEFYNIFTDNQGWRILLDNKDNMFVGGISTAFSNGWNIVLIKYNLLTGISQSNQSEVNSFELYQNYPNPFNPSTTIKYTIPESSKIKLSIFDLLGKEAAVLVDDIIPAGSHEIIFNTNDYGNKFSSGVYFYRLISENDIILTKKFLLMK